MSRAVTVSGVVDEYVERMEKLGHAVYPPHAERISSPEAWAKWGRWGAFDFHSHVNPNAASTDTYAKCNAHANSDSASADTDADIDSYSYPDTGYSL